MVSQCPVKFWKWNLKKIQARLTKLARHWLDPQALLTDMLYTWKRDGPVHGKSLWNTKLQSSAERSEQTYKSQGNSRRGPNVQQELHALSPFLREMKVFVWHFAVQSHWGPQGMCWAETEHRQLHTSAHTCTQAHTNSQSQALTWAGEAQSFANVSQRHIAIIQFCEKTAVDADCTWAVTEAWNSRVSFQIGQLHLSKTFSADVFLHFYGMFH